VLDEADRMFDMGFIDEVKNILNRMPARRQTLMFSATIPPQVKRLAQDYLIYPEEVRLGPTAPPAALVHEVWPLAEEQKYDALRGLLRSEVQSAVVFCRTKKGAGQLAQQLGRAGFNVAAIHADRLQRDRERALARFKAGEVRVLVATDVASRGLDIEGLPQVINFDIPHSPEDYVHRIGRTGRAGIAGEAISLVAPEDRDSLGAIEKLIGRAIERVLVPGFEPNAGTVAAVMGRGQSRAARGEGRGRGDARGRGAARPARGTRAPEGADPIFSKPYEPGLGHAAETSRAAESAPTRRSKQVAVLLGGARPSKS